MEWPKEDAEGIPWRLLCEIVSEETQFQRAEGAQVDASDSLREPRDARDYDHTAAWGDSTWTRGDCRSCARPPEPSARVARPPPAGGAMMVSRGVALDLRALTLAQLLLRYLVSTRQIHRRLFVGSAGVIGLYRSPS